MPHYVYLYRDNRERPRYVGYGELVTRANGSGAPPMHAFRFAGADLLPGKTGFNLVTEFKWLRTIAGLGGTDVGEVPMDPRRNKLGGKTSVPQVWCALIGSTGEMNPVLWITVKKQAAHNARHHFTREERDVAGITVALGAADCIIASISVKNEPCDYPIIIVIQPRSKNQWFYDTNLTKNQNAFYCVPEPLDHDSESFSARFRI